jgi:GMP synthase (glutamine-hydrolysing)
VTRVLVLQHIACEPPAAYEDELRAWDADLQRVLIDEGDPLPHWRSVAAIVAMGGPMGALDDERHPWLPAERALIRDAVRAGTPFWGVCLGAQLLAASLGARVAPGPAPEIGLLPVTRTPAAARDPVFRHCPDEFLTLQWHSDTYELPVGATQLARSDAYEQQAFTIGRAYGLQFHLEVTAGLAAEWGEVPAYADSLEALLGAQALPELVDAIAAAEDRTATLARRLFAAWLEDVVGLERATMANEGRTT